LPSRPNAIGAAPAVVSSDSQMSFTWSNAEPVQCMRATAVMFLSFTRFV
jgi:hypothetical protein